MAITAQSGKGKIEIFEDFTGFHSALAETTDFLNLGQLFAGGEGFEDNDAGIVPSVTAPLSGSATLTSANTDADTTFVGTSLMFDVAKMGPLVLETRIQLAALTAREVFVGFTSIWTFDEQLQDAIINASATAFTCVADLCGFYFSNELTASATHWHSVYKGGTTTASTTAASETLGVGPTIAKWQILRLEIDPNGDARWFVDGVLKRSVSLAASTTSDMAAVVALAANTTTFVIGDVDYQLVRANRDWNE